MPFDPPEPPAGSYEPHPQGNHKGTLTEVRDYGTMESLYRDDKGITRTVQRIAIIITSDTAIMESDAPWQHYEFCNVSFAPKSRLTELRNLLRDTDMDNDELNKVFDETVEMVGRKVNYKIRHEKNEHTDKIRAVIRDWEYAEGEAPDLKNAKQAEAQAAVEKAFDGEAEDDLPF